MKKKMLQMVSHEELTEKTEKKEIDFETCPYCGGVMRVKLCMKERGSYYQRGYYDTTYDRVHFVCNFCGSTSPKLYLTPQIIDEDKVKERIIKEYIELNYDEDEDEEEENND